MQKSGEGVNNQPDPGPTGPEPIACSGSWDGRPRGPASIAPARRVGTGGPFMKFFDTTDPRPEAA